MTQFLHRGGEITVEWSGSSLMFPTLHHNAPKEVAEYFSSLTFYVKRISRFS